MGIAEAAVILANLTSSGLSLLQQSGVVSNLIKTANAEGNRQFTTDEWALITGADDQGRKLLADAIAASPAE